jgi:hypothetical protein
VLAGSLGGRALNLCTMGGAIALNDAWMLQRYLERHPPPKGVIIVHVYDVWEREIRPTVLGKIPAATPLALSELKPRPALPAGDWATYAIARWAPLYAENQSLAHMLQNPSRAFVLPPLQLEGGFEARDGSNPTVVRADLRRHMAELLKGGRFTMSATNRASLARIRELAEGRGVSVYLASAPLFSLLTQAPVFQAFHAELIAALDEAAGTSGRVRVILREPRPMPIELLQNVDHVTREGALIYSEELARAVLAERTSE